MYAEILCKTIHSSAFYGSMSSNDAITKCPMKEHVVILAGNYIRREEQYAKLVERIHNVILAVGAAIADDRKEAAKRERRCSEAGREGRL